MVRVGTPLTACETFGIAATSTTQLRRHISRTATRFAALTVALVVAAALVLVWMRVIRTLTEQIEPRPPIGQPRAVVWNNRVFTTDRQLKRYLEAKGASYTRWVTKHPTAFGVIQHLLPASATATRVSARAAVRVKKPHAAASQAAPSRPRIKARAPVTHHASSAVRSPKALTATRNSPSVGGSGISSTMLVAVLAVLETCLVALALLPGRLAPGPLRRLYVVPERRFGVFAAAMAILFGLLVSLYVG